MIKLTLLDRLVLTSIMPSKGGLKEITFGKSIGEKVQITAEELEKFEIKSIDGGGLAWNKEGQDAEFEYDLLDVESVFIKDTLKKLDTDKELTKDHLRLVELFPIA